MLTSIEKYSCLVPVTRIWGTLIKIGRLYHLACNYITVMNTCTDRVTSAVAWEMNFLGLDKLLKILDIIRNHSMKIFSILNWPNKISSPVSFYKIAPHLGFYCVPAVSCIVSCSVPVIWLTLNNRIFCLF